MLFRNRLFFFVFFIFSFCCFGQQSDLTYLNNLIEQNKTKTDEILLDKTFKNELKKQKTDIEKINIEIVHATLLAELYFKKVEVLNPKSEALFKEAILKSLENNTELTIWTNTQYGFYLYTNSLYKDALPHFLTASRLIDKSVANLTIQPTDVLKKNAYYFGSIEDYKIEANYLKKALKITAETSSDYAAILNNIGRNYANTGNNEEAKKYYNETLRISKINNDEIRYAKALGDLASLFDKNKKWEKAEEYLLQDIAISKEHNGERNTMFAQIQLGNLYYKKNKYEKALEVLKPAEDYAKSKSNLKGFEEQIAKLKLAIAIQQNDDKTELQQRRKLDTLSLYVSQTEGEQVINKINLETEKENIKLQLVAEKQKAEKQLLIRQIELTLSLVLLTITILLLIVYRRKVKQQQVDFDQKILSFEIDKIDFESQLDKSNNSLTDYKTFLIEKNNQIKNLEEEIFKKNSSNEANVQKENYKKVLLSHLLTEDNWQLFKNEFIKEQKEFYENTIKKYPTLTESNLRLIILVKMGLTNLNIANLLGVTIEAVKKAKQRIKKKHEDILRELD